MSDVYGGSFPNIVANSSSHANGGIFQDRNPLTVTPPRARMIFRANRWLNRKFTIFFYTQDLGILEHVPLGIKAWMVQERLPAHRTIHFLSHKAIQECSSLRASESDTTGVLEQGVGNSTAVQRCSLPFPKDQILFAKPLVYGNCTMP